MNISFGDQPQKVVRRWSLYIFSGKSNCDKYRHSYFKIYAIDLEKSLLGHYQMKTQKVIVLQIS
jgi:hypothetical protein